MDRLRSWLFVAALALLLIGGCASSGDVARLSESAYPALPDDAPVEVTTGDLDGPYEELDVVVVRPTPWKIQTEAGTIADTNERLRSEARRLGAQAVVRVNYDVASEETRAAGTVVGVGAR